MPALPPLHPPTALPASAATFSLPPTALATLAARAAAAKRTAYCPYSRFRVGCALLLADGAVVTGANVENVAFPVGTCAERVALGKAVTGVLEGRAAEEGEGEGGGEGMKGGWRGVFRALAVATDVGGTPTSPCGMCRQFIREFCDTEMPVYMFNKEGSFMVLTLGELLPLSFGPEALPSPEQMVAARDAA